MLRRTSSLSAINRRFFTTLWLFWTALILYLTLSPGGGVPRFEFLAWKGVDKAAHAILFFVWTVLLFPEFFKKERKQRPGVRKYWVVATNALVLGLIIEVVQRSIPGRSADMYDLAADMAGVVLAMTALKFVAVKEL